MVEVMTIHKGNLSWYEESISSGYGMNSKKITFGEMRLNSLEFLGTSRILLWHFPRARMLRLICLGCFYLVDQKYFREFMGEMGCQLGLMLNETKVANIKQFGDI